MSEWLTVAFTWACLAVPAAWQISDALRQHRVAYEQRARDAERHLGRPLTAREQFALME